MYGVLVVPPLPARVTFVVVTSLSVCLSVGKKKQDLGEC